MNYTTLEDEIMWTFIIVVAFVVLIVGFLNKDKIKKIVTSGGGSSRNQKQNKK